MLRERLFGHLPCLLVEHGLGSGSRWCHVSLLKGRFKLGQGGLGVNHLEQSLGLGLLMVHLLLKCRFRVVARFRIWHASEGDLFVFLVANLLNEQLAPLLVEDARLGGLGGHAIWCDVCASHLRNRNS